MRIVLLLAWLPMGFATLGGWLDERRALGFTIWRGACRASGFSPTSLVRFTFELLPDAVIGALLGSLLVLVAALPARVALRGGALAAHAGCTVAMPVGLWLCASAWPWPLMLAAEAMLAAFAAASVWWFTRIRRSTYARASARGVSRIPPAALAAENFPVNNSWTSHDCN